MKTIRHIFGIAVLVACASAANAAAIDPERIAAIDQAADALLATAKGAAKTAALPRQSDPTAGRLLDTVFDTADLSHGTLPFADLKKLDDWLQRAVAVGRVYLSGAPGSRGVGNLTLYAPEIGRFVDAAIAIVQAMAECVTAELETFPTAAPTARDLNKVVRMRTEIAATLAQIIRLFANPAVAAGWGRERMPALVAAGPGIARFLAPDNRGPLRATALQVAAASNDATIKTALASFAQALAAPPPATPAAMPDSPAAPPPAAAAGEIALGGDSRAYRVPVRINGTISIKFIVDSGASDVVIPGDVATTLSRAGAIVSSDYIGRETYVIANGTKHPSLRLVLRELNVGGHVVKNVTASIGPARSEPLLGQSFLSKFKSWTLDNGRHLLIVVE